MSGPSDFLSCSEAKTEEIKTVSERPRAATGLPHSLCVALSDDALPRHYDLHGEAIATNNVLFADYNKCLRCPVSDF